MAVDELKCFKSTIGKQTISNNDQFDEITICQVMTLKKIDQRDIV